MTFRWRVDDGTLILVFESSLSSSTKKQNKTKKKRSQSWTPLRKLSGSAHDNGLDTHILKTCKRACNVQNIKRKHKSMIRKYHNQTLHTKHSEYDQKYTTITHCRPTHGTARKSHRTITITRHQEDKKVKQSALSFSSR